MLTSFWWPVVNSDGNNALYLAVTLSMCLLVNIAFLINWFVYLYPPLLCISTCYSFFKSTIHHSHWCHIFIFLIIKRILFPICFISILYYPWRMVTIDDEKNKLSLKPTVSYLKTVTEVFCSSELSLFLFPVLNFQFFFAEQ